MKLGRCATVGCGDVAAYPTRTRSAYCVSCIDDKYQAVGLKPVGEFVGTRIRRVSECVECGVRLGYSLEMVLRVLNEGGHTRCEWCKMKRQGESLRNSALAMLRAKGRVAYPAGEGVNEGSSGNLPKVWFPERVGDLFWRLHLEVAADLSGASDGYDPVLVRCEKCGTEQVHIPARMEVYLENGWCACSVCGSTGPCVEDVVRCFNEHGLILLEPRASNIEKLSAACENCGADRFVSMQQLRRGVVSCYICDGAADPSKPHRVYLFLFPGLACYKVGITNAGNDLRLRVHQSRGGILQEILETSNLASALAIEQAVLAAMADYPSTVTPDDFPRNGWTETWSVDAPKVSLADFSGVANRN